MKYLALAIALLFAAPVYADNHRDEIVNTSVQITKDEGACSGTLIAVEPAAKHRLKYTVLTSRHCVLKDLTDTKSFKLGAEYAIHKYSYEGNFRTESAIYTGLVTKVDLDDDFALLQFVSNDKLPIAAIATQEIIDSLVFAEPIYNSSFPYSVEQIYGEGFLGHVITDPEGKMFQMNKLLMTNLNVAPGSSGSAIFIKRGEDYFVISSITGIMAPEEGGFGYLGFLPQPEKLLEFLAQ